MYGYNDLTNTYNYLRNSIRDWKETVKRANGYKCSLTGGKNNLQVHHLDKSFKTLLNEALILCNLIYHADITYYTAEQRELLTTTLLDLHKDVKAVLIRADLHKRFHREYSLSHCTEEDFYEFRKEYRRQYRISKQNCKGA